MQKKKKKERRICRRKKKIEKRIKLIVGGGRIKFQYFLSERHSIEKTKTFKAYKYEKAWGG